jgi:hypothetical protein
VRGDDQNDAVNGGAGKDSLYGGNGNDLLGGTGQRTLYVDLQNDGAANNTSAAELRIVVANGTAGSAFSRAFVISDSSPSADVLI